jgi:hypothetical protein
MTAAEDLAARIERLLHGMHQPVIAAFLADWPHSPEHRAPAPPISSPQPAPILPVLRWLSPMADAACFSATLVAALSRASRVLQWRQTYAEKDVGRAFLDNYGWSEVLGGSGPLASARLACGFLLLGPATLYPRHRHAAEEVYVPLHGIAAWQQGEGAWREHRPGAVIHHAPDQPHAMRTGDTPLLALYLWRGAGLSQKARLDSA